MSGYSMSTDTNGFPVVKRVGASSARSEPRSIHLGVEHFDLYDETGRVLGPTESLYRLLDNGPITEQQFAMIVSQFDDPEVIHETARRLGVRRVKQDDGKVILRLPEEGEIPKQDVRKELGITEAGDPIVAASRDYATPGQLTALASQQHSDNRADTFTGYPSADPPGLGQSRELVPLREAQRLLGAPIIGSGLRIVKDPGGGRGRFVYRVELEARMRGANRGTGASDLIEQKLTEAQQPSARYSGKRTGAAETAANALSKATGSTAALEYARRKRRENSARRRAATATRRAR